MHAQPGAMEARYQARLNRYVTAMRNGKPDMVPIRPFVAEFTGVYAGYTCQELAHDYRKAFAAARKCAADFDWDAVVSNMVYVWTGLTQAIGLRYYGIPGIDVPPDMGFQYREPPQDNAFMKPDEYDQLIDDPTAFLLDVWLPRVSTEVRKLGEPVTRAHNLSFIKGGMAMMEYFGAFGPQNARLRAESGTVSAISGILKAPMDIIADKLRGYLGLVDDLHERRDKVVAACEALLPHLLHVARSTADPDRLVPVGYWMHRGGVPFVSPEIFKNVYWATVKPIIEELWADGIQTLFYAEGKWDRHLRVVRRAARPEHRLPRRPGRHRQDPPGAGPQVLPQRRHLQRAPGPRHARRRPQAVQGGDRHRRPRRRLHHGRQRDRPERREGREHQGDDRLHPRVRRLFLERVRACEPAEGRLRRRTPDRKAREQAAGRLHALGREARGAPVHLRRRGPGQAGLGGDRRSGEYVYLADSALVLNQDSRRVGETHRTTSARWVSRPTASTPRRRGSGPRSAMGPADLDASRPNGGSGNQRSWHRRREPGLDTINRSGGLGRPAAQILSNCPCTKSLTRVTSARFRCSTTSRSGRSRPARRRRKSG